jgi:hypothetical protein
VVIFCFILMVAFRHLKTWPRFNGHGEDFASLCFTNIVIPHINAQVFPVTLDHGYGMR